jgi:hypothetical protein
MNIGVDRGLGRGTVSRKPFLILIFLQGYTQEQLDKEENVESIQLNIQYQPTASKKVKLDTFLSNMCAIKGIVSRDWG